MGSHDNELDNDETFVHTVFILLKTTHKGIYNYSNCKTIEEFTLIVASWVIRAKWREIRRFLFEFKAS